MSDQLPKSHDYGDQAYTWLEVMEQALGTLRAVVSLRETFAKTATPPFGGEQWYAALSAVCQAEKHMRSATVWTATSVGKLMEGMK